MTKFWPMEITQLLLTRGEGEQAALDRLTPLAYDERRRMAHRYAGRERPGHTLQTSVSFAPHLN